MVMEPDDSHIQWEEKISIEPDLGDQRRSTYKALPAPPKTPKRVMMKYRFSGVFPFIFSLGAFILPLLVVLADHRINAVQGQYLIAINTSAVGKNIITFERADATTTDSPSNTDSSSSTLHPTSTSDPLRELSDTLDNLSGNLTAAINAGLGRATNDAIQSFSDQIVKQDHFFVYLQKLCFSNHIALDGSNGSEGQAISCHSWEQAEEYVSNLSKDIHSSIVIGQTRISIPLLTEVMSSSGYLLKGLSRVRKAVFAFLILTLIGSMASTVSIVPAVCFPQSRLLVYLNGMSSALATACAIVAAVLLSTIFVLTGLVNNFSNTVGIQIERGATALLFVWLSAVFAGFSMLYWTTVWFVETRKSSFVKRHRDEDEIGNWKGMGKEVWRDIKGRRRRSSIRDDI
ncbi:hypothetical protein E8E13_009930 [Curvularia kusanoi]|uniref:Sur7 protein n=1 Tax=Curvularia kusanoi TaxID=90978 RepID=A0A9P4TKI9_CURKU|nr:hypothetical protein E8E13_009930 [Curvularia kusanoi]